MIFSQKRAGFCVVINLKCYAVACIFCTINRKQKFRSSNSRASCSGKKGVLIAQAKYLKRFVMRFIFSKIAGQKHLQKPTLQEISSFIGIFEEFCVDLKQFTIFFQSFLNNFFRNNLQWLLLQIKLQIALGDLEYCKKIAKEGTLNILI